MNRLIADLKESGFNDKCDPIEQIAFIQQQFSQWFPFENLDVLNFCEEKVTEPFLLEKMVIQRRGGLCYEINSLLYLVLKELNFNALLAAGTVNNEGNWALHRTHALILIEIDSQVFVIDNGFGNRIALAPIAVNGAELKSPAGIFRAREQETEKGSHIVEIEKAGVWTIGYAFTLEPIGWQELSRMKHEIHTNPSSPFNKRLLITSVKADGTQSINEDRLTEKRMNSQETTTSFTSKKELIQAIESTCSPSISEAARKLFVN